jgi:hypothetical protein
MNSLGFILFLLLYSPTSENGYNSYTLLDSDELMVMRCRKNFKALGI